MSTSVLDTPESSFARVTSDFIRALDAELAEIVKAHGFSAREED